MREVIEEMSADNIVKKISISIIAGE